MNHRSKKNIFQTTVSARSKQIQASKCGGLIIRNLAFQPGLIDEYEKNVPGMKQSNISESKKPKKDSTKKAAKDIKKK